MEDKVAKSIWSSILRRHSKDSSMLDSGKTSPMDESNSTSIDKSGETTAAQGPETQGLQSPSCRDEEPPYAEDENGRLILTEAGAYEFLGFSFPWWKKWTILIIVFLVQVSMNLNTSLYSNAIWGMTDTFGISAQTARSGAAVFLICYAAGCELWAPWSEDCGRWPVMQLSLFLVNMFQLPVALAQNFGTVVIGRILGGFASAGGSVTLAMVADMWEPEDQQWAVAFVVFSSVGGSVLGPVVGGFSETHLGWRWSIWLQLFFGIFVQLLHLLFVPETRSTILLDRVARDRRRAGGNPNVFGPNELTSLRERLAWREVLRTWWRPFHMFWHEPIVSVLSLLSGFSDALIFMFIQSFGLVYSRWNFNGVDVGLTFIPILVGYFIGYGIFGFAIKRNVALRAKQPGSEYAQYEHRLYYLLWTAPFLPLGLFGFAWTSTGPPIPWIASMIFSAMVGIANYAIYMATIDYMITAYGPYSASATGGNGFSRDFLAGILTLPATPFYKSIGTGRNTVAWPSTILAVIASVLVGAVWVIYKNGAKLRKSSPFAQDLSSGIDPTKKDRPIGRARTNSAASQPGHHEHEAFPQVAEEPAVSGTNLRLHPVAGDRPDVGKRTHSWTRSQQDWRIHNALGSRVHTPRASGHNTPQARSRNPSPVRQTEAVPAATDQITSGETSSQIQSDEGLEQNGSRLRNALSILTEAYEKGSGALATSETKQAE